MFVRSVEKGKFNSTTVVTKTECVCVCMYIYIYIYICIYIYIPSITLVNTHNVFVTKIVDSSSIQCAETKYGL